MGSVFQHNLMNLKELRPYFIFRIQFLFFLTNGFINLKPRGQPCHGICAGCRAQSYRKKIIKKNHIINYYDSKIVNNVFICETMMPL